MAINSQASASSTLNDIPNDIWRDHILSLLRARDYCNLAQVSSTYKNMLDADGNWKPIVTRYYPKPLVDMLHGQYHSAVLNILDNREGITYNNIQHENIMIYELNFDGTILAGTNLTKGSRAFIGQFKDNQLKTMMLSDFLGHVMSIDWQGATACGSFYTSQGKNYVRDRRAFIWDQSNDNQPIEFDEDAIDCCMTQVSRDGQNFIGEYSYKDSEKTVNFLYRRPLLQQAIPDKINNQENIVDISVKTMNYNGTILAGNREKFTEYGSLDFRNACFQSTKVDQLGKIEFESWPAATEIFSDNIERNSSFIQTTWDGLETLGSTSVPTQYFTWTSQNKEKFLLDKTEFADMCAMSQDGQRIVMQAVRTFYKGGYLQTNHKAIVVHSKDKEELIILDNIFEQRYEVKDQNQNISKKFIDYINYDDCIASKNGFQLKHICMNFLGNVISLDVSNRFEKQQPHQGKINQELRVLIKKPRYDILDLEGVEHKDPGYTKHIKTVYAYDEDY